MNLLNECCEVAVADAIDRERMTLSAWLRNRAAELDAALDCELREELGDDERRREYDTGKADGDEQAREDCEEDLQRALGIGDEAHHPLDWTALLDRVRELALHRERTEGAP